MPSIPPLSTPTTPTTPRLIMWDALMAEPTPPTPSWGHWRYEPRNDTLVYREPGIGHDTDEVDLEQLTTSAELLDAIFQVAGKTWANPAEAVGSLMLALQELLSPQAHYCSGGQDRGRVNAHQAAQGAGACPPSAH